MTMTMLSSETGIGCADMLSGFVMGALEEMAVLNELWELVNLRRKHLLPMLGATMRAKSGDALNGERIYVKQSKG